MKDEYIIVLDFLSRGRADSRKAEPTVQGIGVSFLNLLEIVLKPDITVKTGDLIYIGEMKRDKVRYIKGRIRYDELTAFAKDQLEEVIDKIITQNEKKFVDFFNTAGPVSTRLHSLELLPGIGKKHMWAIINERRKKKFEDFEDLKKRVGMLPEPKRMIKKRIIEELKESDRHRLFVISPPSQTSR
jgi:putative nucleotide binding protein